MFDRKETWWSLRVGATLAQLLVAASATRAHHPRAVDPALKAEAPATGFRIEVSERYTASGTLQDGNVKAANPASEFLDTSLTQIGLAYDITTRFGARIDVPIVVHEFRRLTQTGTARGDETGFGDLALLGVVHPVWLAKTPGVFRLSLYAGLKLPSGDASRLAEEDEESETAGSVRTARHRGIVTAAHETEGSGVHGHDLALGSGSVDGIVGGSVHAGWHRLFASATLEYAIRTEGDFDYRYANDLVWSGGPGVWIRRTSRYSLGLQTWLTGLTKGKDEQNGRPVDDTGFTGLYMGPRALFTWGRSLAVDMAGELPLVQNNTGLQIVPDWGIRAGVGWRF
jgi:hypothetical protein